MGVNSGMRWGKAEDGFGDVLSARRWCAQR